MKTFKKILNRLVRHFRNRNADTLDPASAYALREQGLSLRQIGQRLGVSHVAVWKTLQAYRPPAPLEPEAAQLDWSTSGAKTRAVVAKVANRPTPPQSSVARPTTSAPTRQEPPKWQGKPVQATFPPVALLLGGEDFAPLVKPLVPMSTDRPPVPFIAEDTPADIALRTAIALDDPRIRTKPQPRQYDLDPRQQNPCHHPTCRCLDCCALRGAGWIQKDGQWVRLEDVKRPA